MDEHLAALLGLDPDDPDTAAAGEDTELIMDLIQALVIHRKASRLTRQAVAQAMQTTRAAIAEFERLGGDPTLSTIMRYARAIGMTVQINHRTD